MRLLKVMAFEELFAGSVRSLVFPALSYRPIQ